MKNILISRFLNPYLRIIIAMFLCISSLAGHAADAEKGAVADPEAVMKVAINDVLVQLKNNEALYKNDPQQLRNTIATLVLPHFNIQRMAQLALAKHWRSADVAQREMFVHEFQRYLIRSYTETLYLYRNAKPEMLGANINDKDDHKATLKMRANNERGEAVILFLRLELAGRDWKIVDINVEGVSLVITTRGVFDEEINKVGLDGFLKNLSEKNNNAERSVNE